jgi:hypothetical protein
MPSTDPRYKLILTYDVQQDMQDTYLQFMLGELVPAVQSLGLQMTGAWHTAYGQYPIRLIEFIGEDQAAIAAVLDTPLWNKMEARLLGFVANYSKKILRVRDDQFQF